MNPLGVSFVCENGLVSFEDSNNSCDYPTDLKNSTACLIVGFFGEDVQLNPNCTESPYAYYDERSTYDENGCFNMSNETVMAYLHIEPTHIFVSTWHRIQNGIGTVQIVIATQERKECKNETYALLIYNNTNLSEEDKEQIGFTADGGRYYSLSNITGDSNIGVPGVYAFRIDKPYYIDEPGKGIHFFNGSENDTQGLIEVCHQGEWRSVCDDYWTDHDAKVACEQLGFSKSNFSAKATKRGEFEREFYKNTDKSELYWFDDVQCAGNETSLFKCKHKEMGTHNCGRKERAGVKCIGC
ncbi:Deleted in malignant brain tumors 1 protein [Geodia barretti]|uniref:Deleted in malignant brain tumors 1 protein n=1 Tax=Geodia barretti TaxID=519541 RepID=A0AA35T995_GEOBA|nr:Deleted in malignant brain tumors 1 protein [Geodia barretti]